MKIAVNYENGQIFQHFGQTKTFKVYTVENNAVTGSADAAVQAYLDGTLVSSTKAHACGCHH